MFEDKIEKIFQKMIFLKKNQKMPERREKKVRKPIQETQFIDILERSENIKMRKLLEKFPKPKDIYFLG